MAEVEENDAMLLSLIQKEIPEGRSALNESHKNLAVLSNYCRDNYYNSDDKAKALEETKAYASQSLASVAYQIHSLAVNILQMMDQQTIQLQKMQSDANNIGLIVDIHKEKVARREIGVLTSSKNFSRSHKIVAPQHQEKAARYKREEINYNSLDEIGHGVKSGHSNDALSHRRASTSSSSGSVKSPSLSSSKGSLPGSIYQSVNSNSASKLRQDSSSGGFPPRPPVAPVAPMPQKVSQPPPAPPTAPGMFQIPAPDYEDDEGAELPPPPPDMDDLYQIPTNNAALDDDLPPPPPPDFDDMTSPSALPPPPPPPPPGGDNADMVGEKVIAIYDYQKLRDDELQLTEGDIITVIKKNDDGWFEGVKDGIQGLFPGNYVTSM